MILTSKRKKEKSVSYGATVISTLILCFYYFTTLSPPNMDFSFLRWYVLLILAIFVFIIVGRTIKVSQVKIYLVALSLIFIGGLLSLFRTPDDIGFVLFNTISLGIGLFTLLLMYPTLISERVKWYLLFTHIAGGMLWVLEIQRKSLELGIFIGSTFSGSSNNKNAIGLILGMTATALIMLALHWDPDLPPPLLISLKVLLGVLSIFVLVNLALLYSRSQIIIALIGVFVAISSYAIKARGVRFIFRYVLISIVIIGAAILATPYMLSVSPYWSNYISPILQANNIVELGNRGALVFKALSIISDNPFIGIGPGNAINSYSNYGYSNARGLIHNTYLSYWAELGFLGFIAITLFITTYVRAIFTNFYEKKLIDQVWLVVLFPFILGMGVKNLSFSFFFLLVISTFSQENDEES